MSHEESPRPLPELAQGRLDADTLERLFEDIGSLTRVLEVLAKPAARGHALPANLSLAQARDLLAAGQVCGVQVRYVHAGEMWLDTLLRGPDGVRLTRLRVADVGD
jgi:hypothetical protein